MKTENTLRTVRNSLLCFFMALGAGFLVACGGGGGGTSTFSTYLTDASVEGAEYSGPTSSDVTGEDGVFTASEGVFEFSVGATTLGSVQLNSNWADSHVTPADFMGANERRVITIARILQGLDENRDHGDGISISQSARDLTVDLFSSTAFIASLNISGNTAFTIAVDSVTLVVPDESIATERLIATRQCLFSGGYMGDYRSTFDSDNPGEEGRSHFVFEPKEMDIIGIDTTNGQEIVTGTNAIIEVRGVEFTISSDGSRGGLEMEGPYSGAVGVRGTVFAFTDEGSGNELTFVTPRLVTGIWADRENMSAPTVITDSGTFRLTRVAGDPTANRRVVGVEVETEGSGEDTTETPVGIYVLDYFAGDSEFRGQYYDVGTDQYSDMRLTVASGDWPTETSGDNATMMVALSGTLGGDDTSVTVQVTRSTDTIGSFAGGVTDAESTINGSWCDLR